MRPYARPPAWSRGTARGPFSNCSAATKATARAARSRAEKSLVRAVVQNARQRAGTTGATPAVTRRENYCKPGVHEPNVIPSPTVSGAQDVPLRTLRQPSGVTRAGEIPAKQAKPTRGFEPRTPSLRGKSGRKKRGR